MQYPTDHNLAVAEDQRLQPDVLPSKAANTSGDCHGDRRLTADAFCGWIATADTAYAAGSTAEPVPARSAIVGLAAEIEETMSLL
ncbi:hypothetical protein GGF50DRAFT_127030 [Schizophyllum commune]